MIKEENNLYSFANLYNVRHLGGYIGENGKLKNHKYIRGSAKGTLNDEEKAFLYDLGTRVIIDLRYGEELEKVPSPLKNYKDSVYYHVDMMGEFWQMKNEGYGDLSELYIDLLDDSQAKLKAVFSLFAKHQNEGIYFHCTAGKDRTGVIAMILLDLLKVNPEDIIANYAESYENNKARPGYKFMKPEYYKFVYSPPEYMEKAMDHMYKNYGNAEAYLKHIGVTEEEITAIKNGAY